MNLTSSAIVALFVIVAALTPTPALRAQVSGTFTGVGANWSDPVNWSSATPDAVPGSTAGDSALLNAASNTALEGASISLGDAGQQRILGALSVTGGANVGSSGTLTLGSAGQSFRFDTGSPAAATLGLSGGATLRILANVSSAGDLAINNNSVVFGSITLAGSTAIAGAALFNVSDADGAITIAGSLTAASLVKNGAGSLFLNSTASIAGDVSFNAGSIVVGANNALGTGAIILNNSAALRLNLAGSTDVPAVDRSLANSIDLSTTDLIVGRADQNDATALRTLSINPATALTTSIGSGTRTINVESLTNLAFGANQSFTGGVLLKQGGGVLTLAGAQSDFAALDVRIGSVRGDFSTDMTLGSGPGILGSGSINVSGNNTILELTASNPAATLTLGSGAFITLSNYATFRLTGGGLALIDGTIDLGTTGLLDYGSGNVTLGSTQILGAPATGFNFGGDLAFHNNETGIIDNASFVLNLTGTGADAGAQTLSRAGAAGNVAVSAAVVKNGSGETIIDTTITRLDLAGGLSFQSGVITLGKANHYTSSAAAGTTFTGNAATFALRGFDQANFGNITIAPAASANFVLGGSPSTATTLGLGSVAFGDTSTSLLRIRDYIDGTLRHSPAPDVVTAANAASLTAAELSQIWFYGYNKGATVINTNELAPVSLLDSTWSGNAQSGDWFAAANWGGGDDYEIPNSPGAMARIPDIYNYGLSIRGGSVTLGQFYGYTGFTVYSGTLIFDSGASGVPAIWKASGDSRIFFPSVVLNSDVDAGGSLFSGQLTGTGKLIITTNNRVTLSNSQNTFSGGIDLLGGVFRMESAAVAASGTSGSWAGAGTITVGDATRGGTIVGGDEGTSAATVRSMTKITNPIVLNNTLRTASVYYDWSGDVDLAGNRTINIIANTKSSDYGDTSVVFGSGFNFTGVGSLTITGSYQARILSANNDFTGGFTLDNTALVAVRVPLAAGAEAVLGRSEPGKNYVGAGNITLTRGYLNFTGGAGSKVSLEGSALFLNGGSLLASVPLWLNSGTINGSNGYIRFDSDIHFNGSAFAGNPVIASYGSGVTKTVYVENNWNVGVLTGFGDFRKAEKGTTFLDASVAQLAPVNIRLEGGVLKMGAADQIQSTNLIMAGGALDTNGFSNNAAITLQLTDNSSFLLGANDGLTFGGRGAWNDSNSLLIQGVNANWSADVLGAYIRFTSDPGTGAWLDKVAFTGFADGATVTDDGTYWYLTPIGASIMEWLGGATPDVKWGMDANWLPGAAFPNAAGAGVFFRDLDGTLNGKTIDVDGAFTLGHLDLNSNVAQTLALGGAGSLTFDNAGSDALIKHDGVTDVTLRTAFVLDSNAELRVLVRPHLANMTLANQLSGTGALIKTGAGNLHVKGDNTGWTGDFIWDDVSSLRIEGSGRVLSDTGKFYIGGTDGTTLNPGVYLLQAYGANRTVDLPGGYVLNSNLALEVNKLRSTSNNIYYNLTLDGPGTLGDGMHSIDVAWDLTNGARPVFSLDGVIDGDGGIIYSGQGGLALNATNIFTGTFIHAGAYLEIGADNALGAGAIELRSRGAELSVTKASGARLTNRLVLTSDAIYIRGQTLFLDANSTAVGNSLMNGNFYLSYPGTSLLILGKNHVIEGSGRIGTTTSNQSIIRFLGAGNTFTGGAYIQTAAGGFEIGASSVMSGGALASGPLGTGTLTLDSATLYAYSDDSLVTSQTLSNEVSWTGRTLNFRKSGAAENTADTLVLDTGTIVIQGKTAEKLIDVGAGAVLRIDSKLEDKDITGNGFTKSGAGVLELGNGDNELGDGILAQAGTVRARLAGAAVSVGAGATTPFGTGTLQTWAASGTAGAFEVIADDGATVTIAGAGGIVLDNNGRFIITGNDVTTLLDAGGSLLSTGAAGQEGSLVAALVRTTDYTLGVKMAAQNWELGAGIVTLARANLLDTTGAITLAAGATLDIRKNAQLIQNLIVDGNAVIDVAGGTPQAPVILTLGNITVNSGLLTFSGWAGDIGTGLGSTILKSTLSTGRVITGVSLQNGSDIVRVVRNIHGENVLLPYAEIFTWDGAAGNIWQFDNWSKLGSGHTDAEQPDSNAATATFNTGFAGVDLTGATITLPGVGNKTLTALIFEGADKEDFAIDGAGNGLVFDSEYTGVGVATTIQNIGVSDVTLNVDLTIRYDASTNPGHGRSLDIVQDGAGALVFNNQIRGADATVTVSGNGAGAVVFNAQNTFSTAFILESGNIWLGADGDALGGPLGAGVITFKGGAVCGVTNGSNPAAAIAAYTDADRVLAPAPGYILDGGFTVDGSGALALHGNGTLLTDSTLTVADPAGLLTLGVAAHVLTVDGARVLTLDGPGSVRIAGVTMPVALEINAAGTGTNTVTGVITSAGNLTKTGAGLLVLGAANTLTGTTTVTGGALALDVADAIASSTAVVVDGALAATGTQTLNNLSGASAAASVVLNSPVSYTSNTLTLRNTRDTAYAGIFVSASNGSIVKTGAATLTLTGSSDLSGNYNRLYVEQGGLEITGGGGVGGLNSSFVRGGGTVSVGAGGYFGNYSHIFVGGTTTTGALTVSGNGHVDNGMTLYVDNGTLEVSGTGLLETGALALDSFGGTSTFALRESGTVLAGSFVLGEAADSLSTATLSGGWLDVTAGGPGSAGDVYLGESGTGVLIITGSARVRGKEGWVGASGGLGDGRGIATVSGNGFWDTGTYLFVGHNNSSLTIVGSGSVRGMDAVIMDGWVTVGENGLLDNTGALYVGIEGSGGTLAIGSRAVVRTGSDSFIGGGSIDLFGSTETGYGTGAASVSGTGLWDTTGDFHNGYTDAGGSGAGTLSLAQSGSVTVGGTYFQNSLSTLAFAMSDTSAKLTASAGTLSGALSISGYTGATGGTTATQVLSGTTHTLIHATTGTLTGDFATVTGVAASTVDYIYRGAYKTAGDHDYVLGSDLSWRVGGAHAHGAFTIGSGSTFEVDITLSDTAANPVKNWNGDTLTKAGDGTLILSASNAHTGTTLVTGGTLRATNIGAFGASDLSVESAGSVDLSAITGTLANTLADSGTLRIADDAAVTYTGDASAWAGATQVDSGLFALNAAAVYGNAAASLTVTTGGTLAGTGAIGGSVHVNGGVHAPGHSPGLQTFANLTYTNATLDFELGGITNPGHIDQVALNSNDRIDVTGSLTLIGTSTLNITAPAAPFAKGEYDLIHYNTAGAGVFLTGNATNLVLGVFNGTAAATLANADKFLLSTAEPGWVKLLYDYGYFTYWDGGDNTASQWTNTASDGGSGTWYAPGEDATYTAWSGSNGIPNGEWLGAPPAAAGYAIFRGTSGTVTVVNSATNPLNQTSGTIHFSGMQFNNTDAGAYLITGGTLTTGGTDTVEFNTTNAAITATIAATLTGTHNIAKVMPGTLVLAGANTTTGTLTVRDGTLVMTHTAALGAGAALIDAGATLQVATGSMIFTNTLAGAGLLHIDLDSSTSTFAFNSSAIGTGFSGTALFNKSAYTLATDALANAAAVILGAANNTTVATGSHNLASAPATAGLKIDGANLLFTYTTGTRADGIIATGTLDGASGAITIANTHASTVTTTTGLLDKPLLQQDETTAVRLITATAGTGTNLTLAGGGTTTAAIRDASTGTTATATYTQSLAYANGLSVEYTLTELNLLANQTTTLAADAATPAGAGELRALISGDGSLEIAAANAITLSHSNTYTGTTTVTTGTLISGANNALGATSRLVVDSAATYDLSAYTQTIVNGGSIDGALLGTGSLGLGGLVTITTSNTAFAASVGITGTATLASTQALGNTGTLDTTGLVQLDNATGTLAKTIAGTGTLALINTASVALTGINTLQGEWNIAAATALSATSTANLGAATIANAGLLTLANAAGETLANALTGSGAFNKTAAGNLTISRTNAFTGSAGILAGTLTLADLGGVGSAAISNSSTLALSGTGAFANAISSAANTAVNLVTGSVSLRGTNTAFTGTLAVTGAADIETNDNIGATAANVVIAPAGKLTTTATTFTHALTGAGLLAVETSSSTFAFTAPAGNAFTGTVSLADTTMHLGLSNTNAWALANATLHLLAGSTLATNAETRTLGGLNMGASSVTLIDMTAVLPAEVLRTGTLSVDSAAKVAFAGYTGTPITSPTNPVNFLDQDDITENATLLIATDNLKTPGVHVAIVKTDGTPLAPGQQIDYGAAIATYDYTGVTGTATGTTTTHGAAAGLYYDYLLTTLNIKSGSTLVLDSTTATDNYKTLAAEITGSGNLELIAGTDSITLSHSNSYTGTTTLTSGTAIAGANDALGHTAYLTVTNSAALNLNGHTQTIRDGGTIAGNLFGTGSLGLGGLVTITSTNTGFSANAGITGTTTLANTQALGDTGTLDTTGLLQLDNATGSLAKQIAGTGTVALIGTSSVALTAANTLQGEWRIATTTALHATTTANLGAAAIANDGLFTLANTADETLANALSGTGAFNKTAAGNLTISHTNAFTGKTTITAGTLTLQNLGGVGTNTITNNANLALSGTGAFTNAISSAANTALTLVTGSVSLRGDNSLFTGTLAITGTADITTNNQIGATNANAAQVNIATAGKLATTATTFEHALTGGGVLYANTGASFTFEGANVGTLFTGTVTLASTAMRLTEGVNTSVLANATLQLDAASALHTDSVTGKLHALTLNGGALWLPMNGVDPVEILNTGTLSIADIISTVVFENYTSATVAPASVVKNFLDQDNLTDNATLLVAADSLAESAPRQIAIKKADGAALSDGQIIDYGNVEATYNYAALTASATTGATPETGLYYDYVLTQLNVKDGQTLLLTDAGATDDTLSANITGPGSVTYATGSLIALSGSNSYTGASMIATGTVRADADNALGATSHLILDAATALDLTTRAQTANVITTASTSTLNINSGTLTIQSGGTIDGHITGSGALTLATGTLHITTANTDYAAATTIDAPATARLTDPAALGAAAIHLDGLLHIDNAATGQMQNTLTGAGEFRKTNTGTLTLTTSNPAYNGTATIAAGRVIATQIAALGTAPIAIAANATFEQTNINGTLQNPLTGAGTHHITNSTLAIANAATYTIANTTLNQAAALILADNGIHFGTLTMNNGALEFMNPSDAATITTLGNTPGLFVMHANLASHTANHLDIANAGSATHAIYIRDNNTAPTAQNFAIELVTTATPGGAAFTMANPGGKLEYDLTTIELVRGDTSAYTPNPNAWYLSDRNLSHAADAIINTASTLSLDWASAMDNLRQRLADLRSALPASPSTSTSTLNSAVSDGGGLWLRARGYRLNAGNDLSGMSFKQYGWGVTGGADKAFATETGVNFVGGFIDMGNVDRQFDNAGNGKTRNIGIGAYITLLKTNGWFVDATARHDRYSNDFEAKAVDGRMTRGKYTAKSQSLSVEAGRRLQRTDGWWLEPGVQMAVLWLNGSTYTTQATASQRALNVRVGDSETYQYRALIRAGRQFRDSRWHPYAKAAIVTVDSSGGEITAHGKTFQTDYDGKRFEFGLGATYRLTVISQLYMDYEYARSAAYERPWTLTLGYRKLW